MKRIISTLALIFLFTPLYSQLWKQHADSATAYNSKKNTDMAIAFYQLAIKDLQKDSSETKTYALANDSLGILYYVKKNLTAAEKCFAIAKEIQEKLFGKEDLGYAVSISGLGLIYRDSREYDKAEPLLQEVLSIRKKLLGDKHLSYASGCVNLARLYFLTGNYNKAKDLLLIGKEIRGKLLAAEHPDYTNACNALALVYYFLGESDLAFALYKQNKETYEKVSGKENGDYANACNGLGIVLIQMKEYDKAMAQLLEAKQIRESVFGKKHPDYIQACSNLANLYSTLALYEKAEPLLIDAKEIQASILGKDHQMYATCCMNLAGVYSSMAQHQKAEPLYVEAKQIFEKVLGKEHPDYSLACHALAMEYMELGENEKAMSLLLEAKSIIEKTLGTGHLSYLRCCNSIASLYKEIGEYDKAEILFQEVWEASGRRYTGAATGLAFLNQNKGEYEKAEQLFLQVKEVYEETLGKEHPTYGLACDNLANLYGKMGQNEKVLPLLLEGRKILEKKYGKLHPDYAISCNSLATHYNNAGQYEKVEPLLIQAKEIYETLGGKNYYKYAYASHALGYHYMIMGRFEEAERLYLEAMRVQENVLGKQHEQYIGTYTDLAFLYDLIGKYEEAKPLLVRSKTDHLKAFGNFVPDYAYICNRLGMIYWKTNQPVLAQQEFKESFGITSKNLLSFFQFTNEREKGEFIKHILGGDDNILSFYVSSKLRSEHPYTLALFHRNLILLSSQTLKKKLSSASDTALLTRYNEWTNLKKRLADIYSRPLNERKEDVVKMEEQAGQLEKQLTKLSFSFNREQQKQAIHIKDIQQNLKQGEAAIEFIKFNFYNKNRPTDSIIYVAIVLRNDKINPDLVPLFEEKQLQILLGGSVKNISDIYTTGMIVPHENSNVRNIYQLIWEPLEKYLTGIRKVHFAPAGLLHRVSFAALPVDKAKLLSDKYQLVQLNTTASVVDEASIAINTSDKIALYGGISYNADSASLKNAVVSYAAGNNARSLPDDLSRSNIWEELTGTQVEIDGIKNAANSRYPLTVLSGIKATEESVKALNGKASPAVLHIASHGFFFPDPKEDKKGEIQRSFQSSGRVFRQSDDPLFRSGLLFSGANNAWQGKSIEGVEDGIFTAYEVSNMYLPNTKLVVLSACETALGDIKGSEGVYGLQRAFKMAGVQNLIMSLWKVPDAETAEFMQLFYKKMFDNKTVSDAFSHAQTIMKNKYRDDPYKWAAWVLVR